MRPLALYAVLVGLTGCYTPQTVTETHAMEVWRAVQAEREDVTPSEAEPSAPLTLTAQEAARRALELHPESRVARARVASARTHADALTMAPAVELRVTELKLDELVDGDRELDVGLRLRPQFPALVATQRTRASEEVVVEEAQAERLGLAVREQARTLHSALILGARRLELLQERASLLEGARLRLDAAGSQGAATSLEINLARLGAVEATDELAEARAELGELRAAWTQLLSLSPNTQWDLAGSPGGVDEPLAPAPDYEGVLELALKNRPETRERAARLSQAHADVWTERLRQIPWLSFAQASHEIRPKADSMSWGFALGVDIPVERWFADEVAARRADLEVRRQEERAAILAIAGQVTEALQRLSSAVDRYSEAKRTLVPAIEEARAVGEAQSSERGLEPKRVLRLALTRVSAQLRLLEARRDAIEARLRLDRVLARP